MEKIDGGPAFPCDTGAEVKYEKTEGGMREIGTYFAPKQVPGMSLRDYFAAAALQGFLAHYGNDFPFSVAGNTQDDDEIAASMSYAVADAMLAERAK